MKTCIHSAVILLVATGLAAHESSPGKRASGSESSEVAADFLQAVKAQPKLLRISVRCDGSGRFAFTRDSATYQHKHWDPPTRVLLDGEPWERLDGTPPAWREISQGLDLSKAWVVQRKGRDVIALEHTPDGFDLFLCDSPSGADNYSVTIAIPRRTR